VLIAVVNVSLLPNGSPNVFSAVPTLFPKSDGPCSEQRVGPSARWTVGGRLGEHPWVRRIAREHESF
jgi:hypothetical protein